MAGNEVKKLGYGSGRELVVVVDDLLAQKVDAVVDPANGGLTGSEGVAAAIFKAAGAALEQECVELIKKKGRLPTGAAVTTTAGRLPFKGVIHAVGPRMGEGDEEDKLVRALISAFKRADDKRWSSLAFPAIGSGVSGIPHPICARAYVRAAREFFEAGSRSLRTVRLCLLQGALLDAVKREMDLAPPPPRPRPGAPKGPGRRGGRPGAPSGGRPKGPPAGAGAGGPRPPAVVRGPARPPGRVFRSGPVVRPPDAPGASRPPPPVEPEPAVEPKDPGGSGKPGDEP